MRHASFISPLGPRTVDPPFPVLGSMRVLLAASRSATLMLAVRWTGEAAPVGSKSAMLLAELQSNKPTVPFRVPEPINGLGRLIPFQVVPATGAAAL